MPPGQAPSHPTPSQRLYLAFVRNCKLTAEHTLPAIHFMQSSLVELARMDPPTTYHHAFVYIRQLAVHLRTAISSKNKVCYCRRSRMGAFSDPSPALPLQEAAQPVANWQFLHCISLWSRVLAEVDDTSLRPLVFPLVQVTTGVMQCVAHCSGDHCRDCMMDLPPLPLFPLPSPSFPSPSPSSSSLLPSPPPPPSLLSKAPPSPPVLSSATPLCGVSASHCTRAWCVHSDCTASVRCSAVERGQVSERGRPAAHGETP